ncbi:ATP-binding protein [Amycolatopsis pigmentata]|uniref:ATP-binding protein n=1 Tax=Amycolatopsis pigmentata TaxID=450801 RepID=A0ABW5FRJ2_9PSEU
MTATGSATVDDLGYLWARLGVVERRVRHAVAVRRGSDPSPEDPYRGLYLTPEEVERILSLPSSAWASTPTGDATVPAAPGSRLHRIGRDFGLSELDIELLLVIAVPDVDPRFERLYGYLNDDVTRRRPTIGLTLELCGIPPAGDGRFRFGAAAPLVSGGLVEVLEPERPWLSRTLRVPDRVVAHLLGNDDPDPVLRDVLRSWPVREDPVLDEAGRSARIRKALRTGADFLHLRGNDVVQAAVDALAADGRSALVPDLVALLGEPDPAALLAALVREARLAGAGIVLGPLETLEPGRGERARLLRTVAGRAEGVPLLAHGEVAWDPAWAPRMPVPFDVPPPDPGRWRREVGDEFDPAWTPALAGYRLGAEQVRRAASVAARLASVEGRPVELADLRAGVRAQNGAGLDRLARHIVPAVGWDDLVLPEPARRAVGELALRARHRDRVLGRWRMRPGGGRGCGVTALFAGESGTGKTMSAEVVAAELGMDLYVVDLSTVVDKYVGETEKNLERIFTEAAGVNGVLLFDEADAIFGQRSAVKDAHDRYANVESAFLLQRMESFDGIAVLTTNLRSNMDEAFIRRLDVIADFPMPDAAQRLALWDRCLGRELPRAAELDLGLCAERFELSGGSIRACAVTAAYLAAESGHPVGTAEVIEAVLREYHKLGRLVLDHEFGDRAGSVTSSSKGDPSALEHASRP